jgi:sensor histidine kinase YesM
MWRKIRRTLLILLSLIVIGNLMALIMDPSFIHNPKIWLTNCLFSIGIGYPMFRLNELFARKFDKRIQWDKQPVKKIVVTLGFVIVLATLVILLLNYIFVYKTGNTFAVYLRSTFNMILLQIVVVVYIFSLITAFQFFSMWKVAITQQESLNRKALEMQLETLKNQVNPHFLFNSLNTLTTLVHKDPDLAVTMIMQLSDNYRYVLEQKDKKVVEWTVERQFVKNFLNLQQIRFRNNLKVNIEKDSPAGFCVIPLSVQMLVENAIKHNVISSESPLSIDILIENDFLVVKNNLQIKTHTERSGNVGLENIRQQYELISGRQVEVTRDDGVFKVRLPLINKNDSIA